MSSPSRGSFQKSIRLNKIACLGAGYVGGPTMATIAQQCPHLEVHVADLSQNRIDAWNSNDLPIFEPGLDELVKLTRNKNLFFTTDVAKCIKECDIIFVAVNTPTKTQGRGAGRAANMCNWELAGRTIAEHAESSKIVVEKSTVPVRTAEALEYVLHAPRGAEDKSGVKFVILSNPEFLAEGTAIKDLKEPDRILIGGPETEEGRFSIDVLFDIYNNWVPKDQILRTNCWSSELSKLVANAFLAQRISSINSISMLCEKTGADVKQVSAAVGCDTRIGPKFLQSSVGFGGSCFQKDILNLVYICETFNLPEVAAFWDQVVKMNDYSKRRFVNRMIDAMFTTVASKKIAVFGFAYKKNTGDTRETPAVDVCATLLADQANLHIFDPQVKYEDAIEEMGLHGVDTTKKEFERNFNFAATPMDAVKDAHAIVVLTEWDEFVGYDYKEFYEQMKKPAFLFDGRNLLTPSQIFKLGFEYHSIGRPPLSHLSAVPSVVWPDEPSDSQQRTI